METKTIILFILIGLIILSIIGFIIYWFVFRKTGAPGKWTNEQKATLKTRITSSSSFTTASNNIPSFSKTFGPLLQCMTDEISKKYSWKTKSGGRRCSMPDGLLLLL